MYSARLLGGVEIVEGLLEIVAVSDQAIIKGSCACPSGKSRRATQVESSWLVGVHLVLDPCGIQVVGLACMII